MGTRKKEARSAADISAFAQKIQMLSERLRKAVAEMGKHQIETIEVEIKTAETVDVKRLADAVARVEASLQNAILFRPVD
jgi:benzoyl-CoA reductase/2-hydroxyglutaryl-CoA dehydratase subunit BcrC/BadD/HgdB